MSPLQEDELIRKLDHIMGGEGFSKERMHVTGKRATNFPDLLVYTGDESGESVIVGLEDVETEDVVRTTLVTRLPHEDPEHWDSLEEFEAGIGPWIKERSGKI